MSALDSEAGGSSPRRISIFLRLLLWGLAFAPAIVVLLLVLSRGGRVPFYDSWGFVQQYKDWCEGHYSWARFFAPHNMHPSAVGKAIWFVVMEWFRGDVGLLPLVTWFLALVVSLCVMGLSRPLWRGHSARGAGLFFLVNLSSFTLVMGGTWLWEFVFQNAIPGACLMIGLWALSVEHVPWWRWLLASLASVVATFSFGTGFAVGFILIPAVWFAKRDCSIWPRSTIAGLWLLLTNFVSWLALVACVVRTDSIKPDSGAQRLEDFIERPWDAAQYILALCGHTLGQGTVFEPVTICAVMGLLLLVIFVACMVSLAMNRNGSRLRAAWPWVAMVLWALINALAICFGRWHVSLDTALAARYGQFMLFIVIGVLMLVCSIIFQGEGRLQRWLRKASVPLLVMLLLGHVLSWKEGFDSLKVFHRIIEREKVALMFAKVLPPQTAMQKQVDDHGSLARLAIFLHDRGRFRGFEFVPDTALSQFRIKQEISDKWAKWELQRSDTQGITLNGTAGLSREVYDMPDLVLITASTAGSPEKIIALVAPETPDDFYRRVKLRRKYYDHYFGWKWVYDGELVAHGAEAILHAYTLEQDVRTVRRISGEAVISAGEK